MKVKRLITAVDSHTEGEPARVVTGGVPEVPGDTMREKWAWAQEHLDDLRTMLMFEPRGHGGMSGSIITAPASPEADVGVVFIEVSGFLPMCGHGTIATCTVLVETGIIPAEEPITEITLDTPAGLVEAQVSVRDGVAENVTIRNVPSFLYKSDVEVDVPDLGRVTLDIAWGGNFYAILPAESVGLEVKKDRARDVVEYGRKIREAVYEQVEVVHPENPAVNRCTHVRFLDSPDHPEATVKNAVFYSAEGIDRSPCGTGTSADMAMRYAKGELDLHEEFVSESIIGSLFYGELVEETQVGDYPAVVPTIRGSAYIMGLQKFVLDERDPWPHGFYLGPKSQWGADF
jgi:proline racemase